MQTRDPRDIPARRPRRREPPPLPSLRQFLNVGSPGVHIRCDDCDRSVSMSWPMLIDRVGPTPTWIATRERFRCTQCGKRTADSSIIWRIVTWDGRYPAW